MATANKTTSENLWLVAWRRLRKNKGAIVGLVLLSMYVLVAVFAPWIAPFNPDQQILEYSVKPAMFTGKIIYKKNVSQPGPTDDCCGRNVEDR